MKLVVSSAQYDLFVLFVYIYDLKLSILQKFRSPRFWLYCKDLADCPNIESCRLWRLARSVSVLKNLSTQQTRVRMLIWSWNLDLEPRLSIYKVNLDSAVASWKCCLCKVQWNNNITILM